MDRARIEELLEACGPLWLGGQKELIRTAMETACHEESHRVSQMFLSPLGCSCEICKRQQARHEAELMALV